jgi:ATP-dependent helicase IRC3
MKVSCGRAESVSPTPLERCPSHKTVFTTYSTPHYLQIDRFISRLYNVTTVNRDFEASMQENAPTSFFKRYDLNEERGKPSLQTPRQHQVDAIAKLDNWFSVREFPRGGLLVLPTGGGKTFVALRFLCTQPLAAGYKVLWLAHTHHLLEQAYCSFSSNVGTIPQPKNTLSVRVVSGTPGHFNPRDIKATDDVLITTLQTATLAYKNNHDQFFDFLNAAGDKLFVVFDEAHHSPAPSYRKLLVALRERCRSMCLLGLTATPMHSDEERRGWFEDLFPQKILYNISVKHLIAEGILSKPIFREANTNFTPGFDEVELAAWKNTYRDLPEDIITQLAANRSRNEFIADSYINNKSEYGKTIIFADRWWQCDYLRQNLKKREVRADVVYSHIDADPGSAEARNKRALDENAVVLNRFRNNELDVLINVRMLTEGTDVPNVKTVFLTRQTTSQVLITQMVGRALRGPAFGGTDEAYIVSFIDEWKQMIDWGTPQLLTGEKGGEPEVYKRKALELISIELVRRLADDMYRGGVGVTPMTTILPVGWYITEFASVTERSDTLQVSRFVLVFEDAKKSYADFIQGLTRADLSNFKDVQIQLDDELDRLNGWYRQYFEDAQGYIGGDLKPSLFHLACHVAQNDDEEPQFFEFEERKNHNLLAIAQDMIDRKLDPITIDQELQAEYNKQNRYWEVLYPNYGQFKSQLNVCVDTIVVNKTRPLIVEEGNISSGGEIEPHSHEDDPEFYEYEKKHIIDRDKRCLCCGRTDRLQVDHVISFYRSGKTTLENAQTLCSLCNRIKSIDPTDFRTSSSPLKESWPEFLSLYYLGLPHRGISNDVEKWGQLLRRSINFFYKCAAVDDIKIGKRGYYFYNWDIELHDGIDRRWIEPYVKQIKAEIDESRRKTGTKALHSLVID